MPLIVLLALALASGGAAAFATTRLQQRGAAPVVASASTEAVRVVQRHPRLRRAFASRTDARTATGLALTLALVVLLAGGIVVGLLGLLLHGNPSLVAFDSGIASWAHRHASTLSTNGLRAVTQLGATVTVVALGTVLVIVETIRQRSRWIAAFVLLVLAGENLLSTTIKELVDRARPTLDPIAQTLGPSFPSGHTTAAAAFYAAAALVLSRGRRPAARAVLAGLAVGIAVGVAASRVLLDVHWVTDVVGGLALGWAWFAACAIAFGGRLLRYGTTVEAIEASSALGGPADQETSGPGHGRGVRA